MASVPPVIYLFLCIFLSTRIGEIKSTGVTFEDLEQRSKACIVENSCYYHPDNGTCLSKRRASCLCDSSCSQLGICCFDSPFRDMNPTTDAATCRSGNRYFSPYLMIDKCPFNGSKNDAFQNQCEEDQNAEDDLMSLVPVTSLFSSYTYKNYFCFRCHEANDDFFFWNVKFETLTLLNSSEVEEMFPIYSRADKSWFAKAGRDGILLPLSSRIEIPEEINSLPVPCTMFTSTCSEYWPKDEIRRKCDMYTSVISVREAYSDFSEYYKNPHCALCNYVNLEEKVNGCGRFSEYHPLLAVYPLTFSFALLLDINRSDRDKVGKFQRCYDKSVWDSGFKKCRKIGCAVPGYVIKDGKCGFP